MRENRDNDKEPKNLNEARENAHIKKKDEARTQTVQGLYFFPTYFPSIFLAFCPLSFADSRVTLRLRPDSWASRSFSSSFPVLPRIFIDLFRI